MGTSMGWGECSHATPPRGGPLVFAHRGAPGYLPEHTLAGVAVAHAFGADFIEQDVVLTRDGQAIVLHDMTLDATTDVAEVFPGRADGDGHYPAAEFTLDEIKRLRVCERRAGPHGSARFPGRFPPDADVPMQIPTLAEELALIQGLNRSTGRTVGVIVEIKEPQRHRERHLDVSAETLRVLAEYGYTDHDDAAIIQSFDAAESVRLRVQFGCKLRLCQLLGGKTPPTDDELRKTAGYAEAIGPSYDLLFDRRGRSRGLAEAAHGLGLQVFAYTVRRDALPAYADHVGQLTAKLADLGVDGFFTDFPDDRALPTSSNGTLFVNPRR